MLILKFLSAQRVCHSHQGHSEQTWKESQRRKGKARTRSGENFK